MEHLYAPWRMGFLSAPRTPGECVFCGKLEGAVGPQSGILARGAHCAVVLNAFPYSNGHLMVVPEAHVAHIGGMEAAARAEMMEWAARCEAALESEYHPGGLNLGMNLGVAAGAGIAAHLHLHIVPRWTGDVNFITVVGNTRVLPEELEQTWERLSKYFRG